MREDTPAIGEALKIVLSEAASRTSPEEAATVIAGTLSAITEEYPELQALADEWSALAQTARPLNTNRRPVTGNGRGLPHSEVT